MLVHTGRHPCKWSGFPSWWSKTLAPRPWAANGRNPQLRQSRSPQAGRMELTGMLYTLKTPNLNAKEFCLFLRKIIVSFRAAFSSHQTIRSIRKSCFLPPSKIPLWAVFWGYALYFYQGMLQEIVLKNLKTWVSRLSFHSLCTELHIKTFLDVSTRKMLYIL